MHGGPQILNTSLRLWYWIPNEKSLCRKVVHSCISCFKIKDSSANQLMGQLPQQRVTPVRSFYNCGVDYAWPFLIYQGSSRSKKKVKCYAALFVCLATRAIHIELVSDLTTSVFLAPLRRFISRRGRCQNIFSDNAINFKGASHALNDLRDVFHGKAFAETVNGFPRFSPLWRTVGSRSEVHEASHAKSNSPSGTYLRRNDYYPYSDWSMPEFLWAMILMMFKS
jgi:hypothetical protein